MAARRGSLRSASSSTCCASSRRSRSGTTSACNACSTQQAATAQQLDQAERDYKALTEQIQGAEAQRRSAAEDVKSIDARLAQIADQIARRASTSPVAGTVLATYTDRGEFVQPGQPLYKIANLDTMELRAYVTETQLARVKLGGAAQVSHRRGDKAGAPSPAR